MDKLKEIQTQINSHTMENIHTMLGIFAYFYSHFVYNSEGIEHNNSIAIYIMRQTDVNKNELHGEDIPFDFPHEFFQDF